ncbi:MAG TPA: hypothetical protein VL084_01995 [Thermoanaerobaculia bacterium]|nr:hypothetical protein [Thermoanaerobaculia bacterium]
MSTSGRNGRKAKSALSPTLVVGLLTLAVLAVSVPGALREAAERGSFYLFSAEFLRDLPKRLAGPGRLRFVLQPLMAILLGIRSARADVAAGRPPYLRGLLFHAGHRAALMKSSLESIATLLLAGILADSVFQWILLGISYPGAAIVVGPVLIGVPYALSRAAAGAVIRRRLSP